MIKFLRIYVGKKRRYYKNLVHATNYANMANLSVDIYKKFKFWDRLSKIL